MTRKADETTSGWRRRYLVLPNGAVILVRGRSRKINGRVHHHILNTEGKWVWLCPEEYGFFSYHLVDTDTQLVALRLQGIPVEGAPRWKHYSSTRSGQRPLPSTSTGSTGTSSALSVALRNWRP